MGPTDSSYDNAPAVNCSTPNVGKDCTDPPVQCGNTRCAMDNQVPYWDSFGLDWLAGGGTSAENLGAWAKLQHGHKHGLGVMTTEWHNPPTTSGIPWAGSAGWNQANTTRSSGCGKQR